MTNLLLHTKQWHKLEKLIKDTNSNPDRVFYQYCKFVSKIYLKMIMTSIEKQKINNTPMKRLYKPLSKKYKKRKNPKHRNDFWINTGTLMSLFRVWKYRHWFIGIPKYIKYPGKKTRATMIIDYLEHGTKRVPARPLFSKNLRILIRKLPQITDTFIKLFISHHYK